MTTQHDCEKQMYVAYWDNVGHSCPHHGVVERAGRWYCRRHDPVAKANRDKARHDALMQKWDAQDVAEAFRQKHERIGRMVMEHAEALSNAHDTLVQSWNDLAGWEGPHKESIVLAFQTLEAVLKEVAA